MHRRRALLIPAAVAILVLFGCRDKQLGEVSGKVTYRGKPLSVQNCILVFDDPQRGIAVGVPLEPNGSYRVANVTGYGLEPGKYRVSIGLPGEFVAGLRSLDKKAREKRIGTVFPAKYYDGTTSGLEIDVTLAGQVYDVELKD